MDDKGTKVLPKKQPPLPQNRILPTEEQIDFEDSEGGPESKVPDVIEIQETQRQDQANPMKETLPPYQPSFEKLIEGKVSRLNVKKDEWEEGFYIVLYQQQLSVYEGNSKEGKLLHQYECPHGAEYRFSNENLQINDQKGQEICLCIHDKKLFNDIWIEGFSTTRLLINQITYNLDPRDDFDETTYSLKFNLLSENSKTSMMINT